jgi:hypothetical protein
MALGNRKGRPPVREARSIQKRVNWHFKRMYELIREGYSKEEASKRAYDEIMSRKFNEGDVVKVKASGYKAKVYDYQNGLADGIKVLVRFYGRHSLDLFNENELERVEKKKKDYICLECGKEYSKPKAYCSRCKGGDIDINVKGVK